MINDICTFYACMYGMYTYVHLCLLTQPGILSCLKLTLKTCAKEPSPNISSTVTSLQYVITSFPKFAKNYKQEKFNTKLVTYSCVHTCLTINYNRDNSVLISTSSWPCDSLPLVLIMQSLFKMLRQEVCKSILIYVYIHL